DKVFRGEVFQLRLNATMTQNVVTYTVVVATDNADLKLKPYMTANLQFEVSQRKGALLVPNEALRYKPQVQEIAPEARQEFARAMMRRREASAEGDKAKAGADKEQHDRAVVWVEEDGFVRPVKVRIGLTDGGMTEIVSGDLTEGMAVVTGLARKGAVGC